MYVPLNKYTVKNLELKTIENCQIWIKSWFLYDDSIYFHDKVYVSIYIYIFLGIDCVATQENIDT